ncbi:hypothetical protein ACFRCG_41790 [Embleya sp. NPDC056575]|uniref:hypothetical protein n=1 Tax=unclassified Embleya TaxID=2699296 RepID=UPI0036B2340A
MTLTSGNVPRVDLACARGEAITRTIRIRTDGTPRPLTGVDVQVVVESHGTDAARLVRGGTSTGGSISVDDAAGAVTFTVNATVTDALDYTATWALWLQLADATAADAIVHGSIQVEDVPR